ncbi:MarR family winged helix-turn-helix transcriptional regulator [Actinoplanes sp. NPDC049265]|uniref:MarR family winged helix-turn-helix transcriptional regulator n=1 Tax=Actinoplanes sp. NPDC049265 TaxID=3363902 RepID=UPI003718BE6C
MDDEALTYQLLQQLHAMDDAINAGIQGTLADLGLTPALADMLWRLEPAAPPPSMRQMAGMLSCDPSTVTFLADRMEQLGYLTRAPVPGDRRTKALHLTEPGVEARRRLVDVATTRMPVARLTVAERRRLLDLMTKALGAPAGSPGRKWDAQRDRPIGSRNGSS